MATPDNSSAGESASAKRRQAAVGFIFVSIWRQAPGAVFALDAMAHAPGGARVAA